MKIIRLNKNKITFKKDYYAVKLYHFKINKTLTVTGGKRFPMPFCYPIFEMS